MSEPAKKLRLFDPVVGSAPIEQAPPAAPPPPAAEPPGPTVQGVIESYLRHCAVAGTHCPEALDERRRTLRGFAKHLGMFPVPIAEARAYHLSDWIEGVTSWKSSSTRKAKANQVNACFNWAAKQGRIDRNPFAGVNYAEAERRPCLDDGTLDTMALHANKRFERAVRFLRLTGCRLSELCRLVWANVDLPRQTVMLAEHKSKKKTGKPRIFALVAEAVALLEEIRREQSAAGEPDAGRHVFVNNRGTPWNRRTLGQQLRRMKARGQVRSKATLHGIRHQAGTEAVKNGAPLKHVALQLGHSSTAITERYYVHLDDNAEIMRAAAAKSLGKNSPAGAPCDGGTGTPHPAGEKG